MNKRLLAILIAIAIITTAALLFGALRSSPITSKKAQINKVYGDGEILVTFNVKIPDWTPKEDKIYIYIDDFQYKTDGGVPMQEVSPGSYSVRFKAQKRKVLKYKYNRNNFGYPTDEEFSPDSDKARREVSIKAAPKVVDDEVKKWRWLSKDAPTANISKDGPTNKRDKKLIVGIHMLDFYQPRFNDFVPSTMKRIKSKGFDYVGFAYSANVVTDANPIKFSNKAINTYTEKELENSIKEARKNNLKVMLSVGVETDPTSDKFDLIELEFQDKQPNGFFITLVDEWTRSMLRSAKIAQKHKVDIFSFSNQWPFWGDKTPAQDKLLNDLINKALVKIKKVYKGKLTTDMYDTNENYDFYKQLDWIGDKWWEPLSANKNPTVEQLRARTQQIIADKYKPIFSKYKKPIFLHQMAYASYDGAAGALELSTEGTEVAEWFPYNKKYPADFQEQADAYDAVLQEVHDDPMFVGVYSFGYGYWDSHDKSSGVRGKPAEGVWVKWSK